MDTARAFSVLSRVLCHLPPGIWWPLCQHSPNDPHVAHALSLPAANLDSLLVLAGVGKETAKGFGIVKAGLEAIIDQTNGTLSPFNIQKA